MHEPHLVQSLSTHNLAGSFDGDSRVSDKTWQFHSQPACSQLSSTELRNKQIRLRSVSIHYICWKYLLVLVCIFIKILFQGDIRVQTVSWLVTSPFPGQHEKSPWRSRRPSRWYPQHMWRDLLQRGHTGAQSSCKRQVGPSDVRRPPPGKRQRNEMPITLRLCRCSSQLPAFQLH